MSIKSFIQWFTFIAALIFSFVLIGFFVNLMSTISNSSTGGISWTHQVFHNFVHGRPFQSSLFASHKAGESVGFSFNPYPYINTNVIHVNFFPYLFAPLWSIWPNLPWLYVVVFLYSYLGFAYFSWKILHYLSPNSARIKALLAIALLLSSGILFTFQQKAQFLLFSGPLILAAYYFLMRENKPAFLITVALLCLVSEDAAMVALTFSIYIFLFERERRIYAYWSAAISISYLVVVLFFIQPAARYDLVLTETTTTVVVLKHIQDITSDTIMKWPVQLLPVLFFLPAFAVVYLLFGKPSISNAQLVALIFVSPLPHWGETLVVGAAHHLIPVISFIFLALLITLGRCRDLDNAHAHVSSRNLILLLLVTSLFVLGNLGVVASNLPNHLRAQIYAWAGKENSAQKVLMGLADEESNKQVIRVIQTIPLDRSLVFLTNSSIEGFIAGRSDIWKFPDYYDGADFLVIQRNAHQSFFEFRPSNEKDLQTSIKEGRFNDYNAVTVTEDMVQAVIHELVEKGRTHRLVVNEPNVVLLERAHKQPFTIPPTTVGFGWVRNIPLIFDRAPRKTSAGWDAGDGTK